MPDRQMIAYLEDRVRTIGQAAGFQREKSPMSALNVSLEAALKEAQANLDKAREIYKAQAEEEEEGAEGCYYVHIGGLMYVAVHEPDEVKGEQVGDPTVLATLRGPVAVAAHRKFINYLGQEGEAPSRFGLDVNGYQYEVNTQGGPGGEVVLIVTGNGTREVVDTGVSL